MKAVIALACIVVYLTSSIDSRKSGCRVPERYCRWIRNDGVLRLPSLFGFWGLNKRFIQDIHNSDA